MTIIRNTYRVTVMLSVCFLLSAGVALAQYEIEELPRSDEVIGDFVVGPGKVELTIEPGESKTTELLVSNRMGNTRIFQLEVEDVTGSQNKNQPVVLLGDDSSPYSLKNYISVPEFIFELEHGQRARIPVTVSVPPDAEPGGLYGSVLITTTSKSAEGQEGRVGARPSSVIVSRIGTLFFITVPGDVNEGGKLVEFETIPLGKKFFTAGPVRFQLLYENTGSIHLNPYGGIRVKNIFGREVAEIEADPWFAFPGSTRFRELVWDREYLMGYYTAEAKINRGYNDVVDTAKVSFVVIPIQILIGGFVGILLAIFLIRLIIRNFKISRRY